MKKNERPNCAAAAEDNNKGGSKKGKTKLEKNGVPMTTRHERKENPKMPMSIPKKRVSFTSSH
jgi:hypothetical protein